MGHEILYCYWCSSRILGAEFDKGAAVLIGNHACCPQCLPKVLASLPASQRETLLAMLTKTPEPAPRPTRNTPRTPIPVPLPAPKARPPLPLLAIGGGVLVASALALVFFSGGAPKKESVVNLPPPPSPKLVVPERETVAREAILKANDAARSGIELDLQVRLWEEAVVKAERTRYLEEAMKGRTAVLDRQKEIRRKEAEDAPYRPSDDLVCIEAERFHQKADLSNHAWTLVTAPPGCQGAGAMAALPNSKGQWTSNLADTSPRMDYRIHFPKAGKYHVWVRGIAEDGTDDSVHVGLDGAEAKSATGIVVSMKKWAWTRRTMTSPIAFLDIPAPGVHVVNLWMREDGAIVDRLLLTPDDKYAPKDAGPPETSR